jgi:multidrug efflux pump subunit AcrA (membrane-fusion protein)
MASIFEGLKAWQAAVVVVLLAGIGGGVYAGYAAVTGSGETAAQAGDTAIPIERGDLVLQVTTDGRVNYPDTETVVFEIPGTVGEVLVAEGDTVAVGDAIARLSDRDRADLDSTLAAARLAVAEARDALAEALDPVDPLAVAEAQAKVSNARRGLEAAIDGLADLQEASGAELAAARLAVAQAEVRLGDDSEALSDLVAGPDATDVTAAETTLRLAQETLVNETNKAAEDEQARNEAAADANESLADAVSAYGDLFDVWLGVNPAALSGEDLANSESSRLLAGLGVDLAVLFDPAAIAEVLGFDDSTVSIPVDDPATAWDELTVFTWLSLFPGTVALTAGDDAPVSGTRYVADELDAGWDAVVAANETLDDLATADALARTASDGRVENARRGAEAGATALADLLAETDPADLEALVQRVAFSHAEVQEAQEALQSLEAGPDALEIETKTSDLAVAEEVLASAEAALLDALAGADADRVALRQAQLAAAVLAVESAEDNLAAATLTSPYAGVITTLAIEVGDNVNRGASAAVVVDQSVVEVVGSVDEIDVLKVAEGAAATVVLDALGGRALPGTVSFVAASPEQGQVVTYEFRVAVEVPEGVSLLEGLTATATVETSRESDVLLVPNNAVGGSVIQPTVKVDTGGGVEERPVTLGQSDGFWTAVLAGLTEGDLVIIASSSSASQFEGIQGLRGLGGVGNFSVIDSAPRGGGGGRNVQVQVADDHD